MRISFRLDQLNSHAHFTIFINGANAGDLCIREDEWHELVYFMENGQATSNVAFEVIDNRKGERR